MKSFKINEKIEIVCDWKKTRNGFKHEASLLINGNSVEQTKICYLNRTWERFEYQSVAQKLVSQSKFLSDEEKTQCKEWLEGDRTDWTMFRTTAMVAQLGNLFCQDKKEQNDWKARMLKAGLGNQGLEMPEDWDTLDEDTKQARLDAVIKIAGGKEND